MNTTAQSAADRWHDEPDGVVLVHVDRLLRDATSTLTRIEQGLQLGELAKAMILTIALGAGLFGATLGAYRGGVQIAYAAAKLPLAMLLTTAVCAPALTSLNSALGRPAHLRRDLALVLCALARASLVLAASAPLVLLGVRLGMGYHDLILLVVSCCSAGGLVGLALLVRGLTAGTDSAAAQSATTASASPARRPSSAPGSEGAPRGRWITVVALLVVFSLVGTQMAWTLRPFLLRPRTPEVVLVRSVEGSFLQAVFGSWRSARGIYTRDAAPVPELEPSR